MSTAKQNQAAPALVVAPGPAFLRVNYGINRRKAKSIEHANGKMRIKGSWSDDVTHDRIRRIISQRHPGWLVTGWCLTLPNNQLAS